MAASEKGENGPEEDEVMNAFEEAYRKGAADEAERALGEGRTGDAFEHAKTAFGDQEPPPGVDPRRWEFLKQQAINRLQREQEEE